jgi:photosystem II stability/assembly factor-like uncharacterized protein
MRTIPILALLAIAATVHAQFTPQTSNTIADLRGIHNVGNGVAWASGTNGTVLRTEDGGYVWQSCSIPPGAEKLDFRGVQAFDANTAIVMSSGKGDQSRLYKTTDGCHTWKLIFTNPDKDGFWDAIQFADRNYGVLFGDPTGQKFYARQTSDGGSKWLRFGNENALKLEKAKGGVFAASNSSLLLTPNPNFYFAVANVGDKGQLFRASFGKVCDKKDDSSCLKDFAWWDPEDLAISSDGESSGVFSVAANMRDGDWLLGTMVAVGGDFRRPEVGYASRSDQGGTDWERSTTPPHGYRSAVAYDEKTKTWITVGPNGTDISTDDGHNWRPVHPDAALHEPPDADRNWNALSLPYVVGPHGRIGKLDEAARKP